MNQRIEGEGMKTRRKRIHFQHQLTSDGPTKSLSTLNRDMDVMTSKFGIGVVHHTPTTGQRILSLDGGGVKVIGRAPHKR